MFVFVSALPTKGAPGAFTAVLFIYAVFACVLIHELAHSLIARRFGLKAKSNALLPSGEQHITDRAHDSFDNVSRGLNGSDDHHLRCPSNY